MRPITPQKAVDVLNVALAFDYECISEMIRTRFKCNDRLASHPTIQVGYVDNEPTKGCDVGFVGIINGFFGVDENGWGCIAYVMEDDGTISHFKVLSEDERKPINNDSQ